MVRVGRIYRSDGRPITHTMISLPGHRVPDFEAIEISGRSIFQILKEHYGLTSKRAERWFTAAIDCFGGDLGAHAGRAIARMRKGAAALAAHDVEAALELDPEGVQPLTVRMAQAFTEGTPAHPARRR